MSGKKVLSVAEIARELELPESTVHYWKNRFAQHLPSIGRGRQKRFKPEALEIFANISRLLKEGHTARDVMEQLSQSYPLQADAMPDNAAVPSTTYTSHSMEPAMQMAAAIGMEIAKSVGEGIRNVLSPEAVNGQDLGEVKEGLEEAALRITSAMEETHELRRENDVLKEKLRIMEAEMIRLRKDRREMEKYLLDKIKSVTT
ncbi:putative transcriptional regulator, MerR family [Pseudodesulfovibrio profundus]|uniref:Putative transcriptional regulator, MerR family n=1 Tax=Pseudodesulfovibrio profundus TaxID=57320 RepID=A0A2C8F9B9_9BACT|nr:MerR family transcriptional regulator [Pseudodesulfovibrio profundus]MBC17736.1 MerR family transcriptional regulator [Desulfovibrio sp.]SOB59139.1 putative transcriptional regulator, MerR family [Pseudodesulfovibrio profundus]|tara:strand:+ start:4883 stop:5488 length:606 start_codon:yes stop_codon:yes gene_type:complete